MAIVQQGATLLNAGAKGEKGDAGSGGGSDVRTVAITEVSQLSNVANNNMILSIQSEITLNADLTFADGAIIQDGGGKINVNGYELTFVNNSFDFPYKNVVIDLQHHTKTTETKIIESTVGSITSWDLGVAIDTFYYFYLVANGEKQVRGSGDGDSYYEDTAGATTVIDFYRDLLPVPDGTRLEFTYTLKDTTGRSTISDASTFKNIDVDFVNFGLISDYDHSTGIGTDNKNVLTQVLKLVNNQGLGGRIGTLQDGAFGCSANRKTGYNYGVPTEPYITGKNVEFYMGNNTIFQSLPHNQTSTRLFSIYNTETSNVIGGSFRGEQNFHSYETLDDTETTYAPFSRDGSVHGLVIMGGNRYLNIDIESLSEFTADNLIGIGGYAVTHTGIYGTGLNDTNFTSKNILPDEDGIDEANSYWDTSMLFNLKDSAQVQEFGEILIGGNRSYMSENGFTGNTCYLTWYTAAGEFIARSERLDIYTHIPIVTTAMALADANLTAYDQVRVSLPTPDYTSLDGSIFAIKANRHINIKVKEVVRGRRQGFSNIPAYTTLDGIHFNGNGMDSERRVGSPAFAIDFEDQYQMLRDITVQNCVFENSANGTIILKGTKYLKFINNIVAYSTDTGSRNINRRSFSTQNGHQTLVSNNTIKDADISTGRYDKYIDNQIWDSTISPALEGEQFIGNTFYHCGLSQTDNDRVADDFVYYKDNVQHFERPSTGSAINFNKANQVFINHTIDFNSGKPSSSPTSITNNSYAGKGFIDGFYINNVDMAGQEINSKANLPCIDINNFQSPLIAGVLRGTGQRDMVVSNSSFARFEARLDGWSTTGIPPFTKIELNNSKIITPSIAYLSGEYVLKLRQLDVDFYAEDSTFSFEGGNQAAGTEVFLLNNFGVKVFKNCLIRSDKAFTMDLNVQATNGAVTFIDCEFENITITPRLGVDKVLYTKAHPSLEVFADNAAAITGGVPTGYMYRTATGEVRMVYTP